MPTLGRIRATRQDDCPTRCGPHPDHGNGLAGEPRLGPSVTLVERPRVFLDTCLRESSRKRSVEMRKQMEESAARKPEQSLSRRSPPPRRRRAGSRGLRPRRFHRPIPRAHPHTQVPGSGLSRGSLPGHASRGCLHGRRPERLGERHGDRGYVLHQTCSRTPSGHQPSELLEQRGV